MASSPQAERLAALLQQHGVGDLPSSGIPAWTAFKAYGREIFGPENVGLLFQVGTYDFTGTPLFYFDPVCQLEITDPDGEHDQFEQLHCEMTCPANPDLSCIDASLWSFDYPTADAFFAAVESLPAFQIAVQQNSYSVAVKHEAV